VKFCSGSLDNATSLPDNNTTTFDALADGTHSNCKISVTDNASNTSDNLSVRSFSIGAITPALAEVTPVPTPDNNTTPSYTFFSTLSGTITYGGSCSSTTSATAGENTITFIALADETYDNCTISVDNNSNTSDNLSVSSFRIDTTAPTLLDNLTIASDNTLNTTLAKTNDNITLSITSSEAIQTPTVRISGQNVLPSMVSDNITWSATYKMVEARDEGSVSLNIVFSDLAGNAGDTVTSTTNGSAVRFDKTAPTILDNLTIASNNTLYTTMAKIGDNITLSITSSEAIQTPTVTIAGQNATVTGSDNITWSATYKMVKKETKDR
jgi:hypothetical protein